MAIAEGDPWSERVMLLPCRFTEDVSRAYWDRDLAIGVMTDAGLVPDPERLAALWSEFVGEPLLLETPGEIFNMGMRFAGHTFLYDGDSFTTLLSQCGFDARRVSYQHSDIADLRGLDLRSPENAVSMYFDCYRLGN